jgi:hypothetical protein
MSQCELCHAAYHLSSLIISSADLRDRDCREKQIATRLHELHELADGGNAAAEWAMKFAVSIGQEIEQGKLKP